jgi:hydroxyacylglutathione hydrolase
MRTLCIPALSDNYIYLLSDAGSAVAVDPGDAAPVLARLRGSGLRLRIVLLTHRHADHTAGADELRRATGCTVAGPDECAGCELDEVLADGGTTACGSHLLRVLAIPGHTAGHVAYHCETTGDVWTGDTLFVGGCGRILEGTAARMWQSLCRLRDLPPGTRVHCGHNYTLDNVEFAASLLPGDPDLAARLSEVREWAHREQSEMPSTIGIERRANLFLRADQASVRAALAMPGADPVSVFAELRRRKDAW